MKLEFLRNGSPDCPLIRLYDFDQVQALRLRRIVVRLARNQNEAVALHAELEVQPVSGCELTLRSAKKDRGVVELSELKFECVLTRTGWLNVAGLIRPFCGTTTVGYQWLMHHGRIALLLSHNGKR